MASLDSFFNPFKVFSVIGLVILTTFTLPSCKENTGKEEDILNTCKEINENLNTYDPKSMDGYPDPAKRKYLGYYKNEQPRLIIEEFYTDTGREFTHFYINADELIYAYRETYVYNKPIYYTMDSAKALNDTTWYDEKKTIVKNSYFFFETNKLKKWVAPNNKEVPQTDTSFQQKQDELVGSCLFMLKMLKTKED